jgi:hypothetical protein
MVRSLGLFIIAAVIPHTAQCEFESRRISRLSWLLGFPQSIRSTAAILIWNRPRQLLSSLLIRNILLFDDIMTYVVEWSSYTEENKSWYCAFRSKQISLMRDWAQGVRKRSWMSRNYRESNLCFDRPARNLFAHAGHWLPPYVRLAARCLRHTNRVACLEHG